MVPLIWGEDKNIEISLTLREKKKNDFHLEGSTRWLWPKAPPLWGKEKKIEWSVKPREKKI